MWKMFLINQWTAHMASLYSTRIFDFHNQIHDQDVESMLYELQIHGAIHAIHTNLSNLGALDRIRDKLGFCDAHIFTKGGRTTKEKQPKWVNSYLRNLDYYPAHLYLQANNEVQYQRLFPRYILFYCQTSAITGGRTFLHSAKRVEEKLYHSGKMGQQLLKKLQNQNTVFTLGYLCQHAQIKPDNYFTSWQEKFQTDSIEQALVTANQLSYEIDSTWIHKDAMACNYHTDGNCKCLMTQISLPNFVQDTLTQETYLRFPRIAMTPPAPVNGYRDYHFSDGSYLTPKEEILLKQIYIETREGLYWRPGEFILFDNLRYGHSREVFTGTREVFVGMAQEYKLKENIAIPAGDETAKLFPRIHPAVLDNALNINDPQYEMPSTMHQWQQQVSARVFDAQGSLSESHIQDIKQQFKEYGFLHIVKTGLDCQSPADVPESIIEALGFDESRQFKWGGLTSGRTQRGYISKYMRTVDYYPNDLFLLPHNEILYQHLMPSDLLFYYATPSSPAYGGRTFVHSSHKLQEILSKSIVGKTLLNKLEQHGFLIEAGFIDRDHPLKHQNYIRSWQDRFATEDKKQALSICLNAKHQFDECWWKEEKMEGKTYYVLMTRINVPAYKTHDLDGQRYLLFPRIAYDGPMLHNGYRRFLLGNDEDLSLVEKELLLKAYWDTREALFAQKGDIILIDNIRYGHSREPFSGERSVGITMGGVTWSDKVKSAMVAQ